MTSVGFRQALVEKGDRRVTEARQMARHYASGGGFLSQGLVYEYWQVLNDADNAYRAAGLSLLAGRVAFLARRVAEYGDCENVHVAWAKFDRLNAGGCGVA